MGALEELAMMKHCSGSFVFNGVIVSDGGTGFLGGPRVTENEANYFYNLILENYIIPPPFKLAGIELGFAEEFITFKSLTTHKTESIHRIFLAPTYIVDFFIISPYEVQKERLNIDDNIFFSMYYPGIPAPFKEYSRICNDDEDDNPKNKSASPEKYVYIFELDNQTIKIGISSDVRKRARNIRTGSGLEILRICHTEKAIKNNETLERELHNIFRSERTIGEFFRVKFEVAREVLKNKVPIIDIKSF